MEPVDLAATLGGAAGDVVAALVAVVVVLSVVGRLRNATHRPGPVTGDPHLAAVAQAPDLRHVRRLAVVVVDVAEDGPARARTAYAAYVAVLPDRGRAVAVLADLADAARLERLVGRVMTAPDPSAP